MQGMTYAEVYIDTPASSSKLSSDQLAQYSDGWPLGMVF